MIFMFLCRLQDKGEARAAGPHHRGQAGGGGLPLRLQHPRHHSDSLHDRLLHPGDCLLSSLQSQGKQARDGKVLLNVLTFTIFVLPVSSMGEDKQWRNRGGL